MGEKTKISDINKGRNNGIKKSDYLINYFVLYE